MKSASKIANLAMTLLVLACCTSAQAGPLGLSDCAPAQGVYQCSGLAKTWDGVPLDTTVTLPSKDSARLPLVADIHGFGNSKWEYLDPASDAYTGNAYTWAKAGYAVLTYTARGLWGSCGSPDARIAEASTARRAGSTWPTCATRRVTRRS
jgi:cephalosporin-C deacetylase-like acetyl esterase